MLAMRSGQVAAGRVVPQLVQALGLTSTWRVVPEHKSIRRDFVPAALARLGNICACMHLWRCTCPAAASCVLSNLLLYSILLLTDCLLY